MPTLQDSNRYRPGGMAIAVARDAIAVARDAIAVVRDAIAVARDAIAAVRDDKDWQLQKTLLNVDVFQH